MIAGGELNKKQLTELRKALASMELPPQKRQRLIWRLAKYGVIAAAKRHVRNQESPDGQKWPGRKTKRKGKMLRNLPKLLHIREMPEIQAVRIYLQGGGYRSMIAGVAGLSIDRIFFEHEAPRGPGTANAYLLLDSGVASAPFVDAVNDYINTQGHHGHGDDMQCYAMPETLHDLAVTVWVRNLNNISDDEQKRLKDGIENLIRCAFRENTDYDVRRTWPYSRFCT